MAFSVLISVYQKDCPAYLNEALLSIFSQTILPNEVVLVKDGLLSSELDEVIDRFADRLKIVQLSKNRGLGEALNIGLQSCTYDLVARMDADDISQSDRFEKQLLIFEQQPQLAAVGSWVNEFIGSTNNVVSVRHLPETPKQLAKYAKKRSPLNHPSVMFRKNAVEAVGGYQHFYSFEDYYLWCRLIMGGYELYNIQEGLLFFRVTPDVFQRRGGWKYAKSELKLLQQLVKMGFINQLEFALNVISRIPIRLVPNVVRAFIYKHMLR